MTLIRTMMERPLDPGYQAAADRREAEGLPRSTSLRAPRLVAATLAIGLVVGVAASNLRADDTPRKAARTDLTRQIETRRTEVDRLSVEAQRLQAEVTTLEAQQLGPSGSSVTRSRELAEVVGAVPLTGPGLVLTLDDAPDAADDGGSGDTGEQKRVLARDLQFVVNALWRAGAEAVSINGNRLTSVSTIRFAGSALVVSYRPLARPYVVTALGDPKELPAEFAEGAGASYLSTLHSTFGIRADSEVSRSLTVPAAVGLTTKYAEPMDTGASPTSGTTSDPEDGSS
ncbi:DUF881 domain-containing protein [Phycicoccus sp. HDW14]|uniref:DUF881 domain-containing protein n=1 Tax=Phycicoccus sp. HDW14 TaxID=2714941 RepID=UPI001407D21C|nr:DUF881 domain-containing protein [Phycicoccus sp. HDW14]QIM20823.1 DUF881 domain-containing protein [Phycicoccus sp. HDW14]